MFDSPRDSAQPQRHPTVDVGIHILRGDARILVPSHVELFLGSDRGERALPQRLRFHIEGDLLCDEMVMVYGRPLAWTGERAEGEVTVPMVEEIFGKIFVLRPDRSEVVTPVPQVHFPEGVRTVAWNYGTVLVRGDDPPWNTAGILHIHDHDLPPDDSCESPR